MKTRITALMTLLSLGCMTMQAQEDKAEEMKYRRSSIYSLLLNHTEQKFGTEIREAFMAMPVPDKYNDHNLSVRVLDLDEKLKGARKDRENSDITDFLETNLTASRLVAKWFNRDAETGYCNMDLVAERGLYNASEIDKAIAQNSTRGMALLADAGEDLIGNTFVLVNDIRYIDKGEAAKVAGSILKIGGAVAGAFVGGDAGKLISQGSNLAGTTAETLKGFKVRINTFLYQLVWDEEASTNFYEHWLSEGMEADPKVFERTRPSYHLKYVGKVESDGSTTSFLGINEDQPLLMVQKACQRALDENVVDLQRDFEAFRTKTPLISSAPLRAYIGKKEGVTSDSRFEVLEAVENKDGKIEYEKVGEIKPKSSLIWDNRFMAEEEGAENATLGYTTFEKVKGKNFEKGMLIREIKH